MRAVALEEKAVSKSVTGQKKPALLGGDRITSFFQNLEHVFPHLPLFG
jgi:hypothetical protein